MRLKVWRKTRIELVEPAFGKLAGRQPQRLLAAKDDVPAFLGVQLAEDHDDQYWDLMHTPGALGLRKAKWMMMMMAKLPLAASRLDGDEKRGEGSAPHLGWRPFWHG